MSNEDDAAWLDALAGRAGAAPAQGGSPQSRSAALEGLALRELLRTQLPGEESSVPRIDPERERELLARARAAGLLQEPAVRPGRRRFLALRTAAAAAAVIIIALGISPYRNSREPAETLRGLENGTVHLESPDPPALRRRLTEELRAAGVAVTGYERLGHLGIDADLPQPLPPQIRSILERHHIPIPDDGALVVEIETAERR